MKKIISLLLALAMIFCCCSAAAAAVDDSDDYPVIIVSGFTSSQLVKINDDGSKENVWYIDFQEVLDVVKEKIPELIVDAGLLTTGMEKYIVDLITPELNKFMGVLACDENGNSVYNLEPTIDANAESAKWTNLDEIDQAMVNHVKFLDEDKMYVFGADFRLSALDNAKRLGKLVDSVLAYTGAEKVNILAQSYGGQLTGTYLSLDPEAAGQKVNNAVLLVPALDGAALAYDFFKGNMEFDERGIMEFVELGMHFETDFHMLLESNPDFLVDALIKAMQPALRNILGTWPSLWDFVPYEYYKELISSELDPTKNAGLIAKTTLFHETISANYRTNLSAAKDAGVNISIIAGYGRPSVTGMQVQSDGIIPTASSTGATCAPYSQRFSDGYTGTMTVCSNPEHNHVSPSMEVDVSSGYLPENTWLVDEYYHGMENSSEYLTKLFQRQLVSKNALKSVHDSKEFSQFHTMDTPSMVVSAKFNNSQEGYVSSEDTALVISNDSTSAVMVNDIKADGLNIKFPTFTLVPAGETVEVPFTGTLPECSRVHATLNLSYTSVGVSSATPVGSRIIEFTLMNGEAVEFDEANPFTDATVTYDVTKALGDSKGGKIIEKLGLTSVADAFYKLILRFAQAIRKLVKTFQSIGG